jgi:hypothetical protein
MQGTFARLLNVPIFAYLPRRSGAQAGGDHRTKGVRAQLSNNRQGAMMLRVEKKGPCFNRGRVLAFD